MLHCEPTATPTETAVSTTETATPTSTFTATLPPTVTATLTPTATATLPGYITVTEPILAGFSAFPRSGEAPLLVLFFDNSTGDIDAYQRCRDQRAGQ
jgi:PKD repeat protein